MFRYFIIYKPYKMLSQFVRIPKKKCLADLDFIFPEGTNAVGRLDENSEGFLILTNDKSLVKLVLESEDPHERIYWVQVHGKVTEEELKILEAGVKIRLNPNDYVTKPCRAKIIPEPKNLPPRGHPVRNDLPTTWIELILIEGKFHQVRKMTAAVGHQTLRLIRIGIEEASLSEFIPGSVEEIPQEVLFEKLKIKKA